MTGIVLGSLAVVLLAGSVALYFATISSNPGPPEEITREPANPPVEPSAESPSASTPAADAPVATPSNPTATPTPPVTAEPTTVAENTPTPPAPVQAEQPRDPTPRTPTLRDPTPRNPTPRDPTVRNPTPRNPTPREPTPGPRVAPAGGSARLFVNTEPWSHVLVGGRDLGTTPVANVEVPSGRVRLTLIDPDGHRFSRTVRVEPGEQKRVFFALQ